MDMEDTLQKLRELEPLELAGQLVLARTGQIPDFFALMETGAANVTSMPTRACPRRCSCRRT